MMSDSDDVPDLVDTSEDELDVEDCKPNSVRYAGRWLDKDEQYLQKQELWMRVFCLAPFLFGCSNIIPAAWIRALHAAKLLLNEKRQYEITFFEWQEWECLDLVDSVVTDVQKTLRNCSKLSKLLDCVEKLDKSKSVIDVDKTIDEAEKVKEITDLWHIVKKHEYARNREKAAKFAVLYVTRIYREHVIHLCEKSSDFIDYTKKALRKNSASRNAEEYKKMGNEHFSDKNYRDAVDYYKKACTEDPFHHVYYGNRAQAYHKLNEFKEALADARRAVTIKPDFPKGYYRYALAFHKLGRLDSALRINKHGEAMCLKSQDYTNVRQLTEQGEKFQLEKNQLLHSRHVLTSIPKHLDEKLSNLSAMAEPAELTEQFGCKPPDKHRFDDAPLFMAYESDSSDNQISRSPAFGRSISNNKRKKKSKNSSKSESQTNADTLNWSNNKEALLEMLNTSRKLKQDDRKPSMIELKTEFTSLIHEGSISYAKEASKSAMTCYQKALELLAHQESMSDFGLDDADLVTLKYAFSMSAIATGVYKNIMDGIAKLDDIIQNHEDIRFPAAYYGLGKAYVSLNRFPEALEPLQSGLKIAMNVRYSQVTWPGTTTLIKESTASVLKPNIQELIQLCRCPPPPDATCRYHTDSTSDRTVIYLTDPDFKGFIKMICQMNCVVTFHQVCWRMYKKTSNKLNDKDLLDTGCPTPDCTGFIIKIHIVRPDSLTKEYVSEKYKAVKEFIKQKKPVAKQRTTNEDKIAKKQEKKEKRKQKKKEHDTQNNADTADNEDAFIIDGASASAFIEDMENSDQPLPNLKDTHILKKDDSDLQMQLGVKGKKQRKKKEKKQILTVEVNFSDRKEQTLFNEHSVLSDEEQHKENESVQNVFSVPNKLRNQIESFEKTYSGPKEPLFKLDEITENLFLFIAEILKANGPMAIDDVKIQQELEVFPFEALEKIKQAGGLADFLKQSLNFAVIDDVIALMSDAKKASELALYRRKENEAIGVKVGSKNAWKTVGKGANNTDGLTESLTVSDTFPTLRPSGLGANSESNSVYSPTGIAANTNWNAPTFTHDTSPSPNSYQTSVYQSSTGQTNSQDLHWSEGISSFDLANQPPSLKGSTIDSLDDIDDYAIEVTKPVKTRHPVNNIEDLDGISESGSEYKQSVDISEVKQDKLDPRMYESGKYDMNLSQSSSKSDISERSYRSDYSAGLMEPKPLRPINSAVVGSKRGYGMWPSVEKDFDSSSSVPSREDYDADSVSAEISREVQKAGEEFVRKSDEKFVSELAESVVEKLFEGKTVSKAERLATLDQVSTDIWKDFERSAKAQKQGQSGLWANTPVGSDYSKNMGKFATDFMRRHYENSDSSGASPTSNVNIVYPQKPTTQESFNSYQDSSGFNSIHPLPSAKKNSETVSSVSQQPAMDKTGYNLFSGPSWNFSSFGSGVNSDVNSSVYNASHPQPSRAHTPSSFIRPPMSASSFYHGPSSQNVGTPPPPFFPPKNMPVRMPMMYPHPMGMPPQMIRIEKQDAESQCSVSITTQTTQTDTYEPYKNEYLAGKEEREHMLRVLSENKLAFEKLFQEYKNKEQLIERLECEMKKKQGLFEMEKKTWLQERDMQALETGKLQENMANKERQEKDLRSKIAGKEKNFKDQRDKDLGEIKKYTEAADRYHHLYDSQCERAKVAELDILKSRLKAVQSHLENTHKEANFHLQRFKSVIKKHKEEMQPVPSNIQQAFDFWVEAVKHAEESLTIIKHEYKKQIEEVSAGAQLCDLPAIQRRTPPSISDAVKSTTYMQPPGGMQGFMMPRMQGPMANRLALPSSVPSASLSSMSMATKQGNPTGTSSQAQQAPMYMSSKPTNSTLIQPNSQTPPGVRPSVPNPVRPLAAPRAPLTMPNKMPLRPLGVNTGPQQLSSYEKLLNKLKQIFPKKSRTEMGDLVHKLRQNQGGSLSGMTMENIIEKVTDLINVQDKETVSRQTTSNRPLAPPPGLNSSWAFNTASGASNKGGPGAELYKEEEEDPCVICHEEMECMRVAKLQCGHIFHEECIRKWFQEQSTCPTCRVHALLPDDFPTLG